MDNNRRNRTLYRDENDKMLGGVCSGLGHYFDIDTMLVRVAFVVVAMLGGGGVLAYVILWAILNPAPAGHLEQTTDASTFPPAPVPPAPSQIDEEVVQPIDASSTEVPKGDEV